MNYKHFFILLFLLCLKAGAGFAQDTASQQTVINVEEGEFWWGGPVSEGHKLPLNNDNPAVDLAGDNKWNQAQPLLLSNRGRYIWSEEPFSYEFKDKKLIISSRSEVKRGKAGNTLREVYKYVSANFFPPSGKMPDELLFTQPQWNTWIELTYNQNEADILTYARSILKHGFSPGVLMIDDTWQEAYGVWDFHPGRFTNPKALIDSLHEMGFKVMLWICPFVSADSPPYRELKAKNALLAEAGSASKPEPAMVRWWNGASAVLDFTAPEAVSWFNAQLERLQKDYAIDGFKFDAGDTPFYTGKVSSRQNISANTHTELFGQFGLKYPLNEYRAMWKRGGQPIAERIADKFHSWEDLQKLVPQVVLQGLEGYSFTCPDMIGGGDYISFLNLKTLDQDLVVRSAQCHALMPMMQFSVAPWRILDAPHLEAVKKSMALRSAMTPKILALAKQSAKTGEPIVKSLEYVFPSQGFATVKDQFMLGDKIMVAPLTEKGKTSRVILIPKGKWKSDEGKIIKGPVKQRVEVPVDRLPYFELMK